jgi:RNA polymerase sigma-70 factor (ECF subfamily)
MATQEHSAPAELPTEEQALTAAAVAGDRVALERLLLSHYDALARRVESRLPPRVQSTQAVEDILQVTFCQAFRDIGSFEPRGEGSFGSWLSKIAENRLLDAIKQHDVQKRGGQLRRAGDSAADESRIMTVWDWIAASDTSPSSVVARNEALHALEIALAALPDDQRKAIRLRLLEGQSLEETAKAIGRTPDAVRGLIHRGKENLQAAMGRASHWLKTK